MNTRIILIALLFLGLNTVLFAKGDKKVRIQIKYQKEIVFDTTVRVDAENAEQIIADIVDDYSSQDVEINSKNISDHYIFTVAEKDWKKDKSLKEGKYSKSYTLDEKTKNEFQKIGQQIKKNFKNADANVFLDSIGSGFKQIKTDIVGDSNKTKKKKDS